MKFFSGSKNWGQVVSNVSERSRYDGSNSKINFAVPDERILRCIKSRLPKVIPPGKIQQSIDLLAGEQDLILMADGKLLSKGLGDNFTGDINLFGHERNPNLTNLKEDIQDDLQFVHHTMTKFNNMSIRTKFRNICELIQIDEICNEICSR